MNGEITLKGMKQQACTGCGKEKDTYEAHAKGAFNGALCAKCLEKQAKMFFAAQQQQQ
jgi:hypothetical protein